MNRSDVLAPGGALQRAIPDYEDRPQQRAMAAAVTNALRSERTLIVEAGTGTGKTLAYLVPALCSGKRIVVSTGTRTLQEQIARHDIPMLEEMLPRPFSAVTLKGVSNYVCRRRLHERSVRGVGAADRDAFATIREWAHDSPTGDRAELAQVAPQIRDDHPLWQSLTTTPETRLGPRCPFFEQCYVTQARRAADQADLVLVNHHLFLADLALRTAYPGARVLPEYEAVVFDEGHQLEETITEHFGIGVSTVRTSQLLRDLRSELLREDLFRGRSASHGFIESIERSSARLFSLARNRLLAERTPDPERSELPQKLLRDDAGQEAWFGLDTALDEMRAHLELVAEKARVKETAEAAVGLARRTQRLRDDVATIAERSEEGLVYWGEVRGRGVFLRASPVEVGGIVRSHIIGSVPTAIITSATLSTAGNFEYLRSRLGLDGEAADELLVESPFDYATQALFYVADDLPEPRDPGFTPACCARIEDLLEVTGGRAFALFTSHRALREATRVLRNKLPYDVFVQGEQPRASLLDSFRHSGRGVLFATGTFWEGVDVPGDALSQVIIDKLPFAPPTDPLTAARMRRIEERNAEPFKTYQLPRAALALKQGFGRLIRRRDDRGIVALLDGRVLSKGYGRMFFNTLPATVPRTSSLEETRRWWQPT